MIRKSLEICSQGMIFIMICCQRCDGNRRAQESPHPRAPKCPRKCKKRLPGPPGTECQKSVEKVPKEPRKSQKGVGVSVRGLFRHFFGTPSGKAQEDLFETFWGFRGSGVWRLLYMGFAIATSAGIWGESQEPMLGKGMPVKKTFMLLQKQHAFPPEQLRFPARNMPFPAEVCTFLKKDPFRGTWQETARNCRRVSGLKN